MKNATKFFGIFALAVAIGFTILACKDPTGPGGPQQLAKPSNLSISGTGLTWNGVENASGYTVDIDGTEHQANTNRLFAFGLDHSENIYDKG
ncbi:MAG: hypothetical protein LBI06_03220 [Treponema sp.]|jgi:hypothetical protein|nr:hypothetical protein [Treponema sp.]